MRVREGAFLCYRVFDVGDEIDLPGAETATREMSARRTAGSVATTEALAFSVAPLVVSMGSRTIALPISGITVHAILSARLFEYGAISVLFEIGMAPGSDLADLAGLADELYDSQVLEREGRAEVEKLLEKLGALVNGRHLWHEAETYTVLFVTALEDGKSAQDVLAWPPLAKLLIGEKSEKALSAEEQRDVIRRSHSYFVDDLAVIDWNSAFVVEPSGARAIPDILEFATSQLLELRYYDGVFDSSLARMYDDLAKAQKSPRLLLRTPYGRLARDVVRRLVELTEFTERVDNSLKVIGDIYLARVYQSAVLRFRLDSWRASIDAKQRLVAQAYELIKGELEHRRSTILELVVILLIGLELANALRH